VAPARHVLQTLLPWRCLTDLHPRCRRVFLLRRLSSAAARRACIRFHPHLRHTRPASPSPQVSDPMNKTAFGLRAAQRPARELRRPLDREHGRAVSFPQKSGELGAAQRRQLHALVGPPALMMAPARHALHTLLPWRCLTGLYPRYLTGVHPGTASIRVCRTGRHPPASAPWACATSLAHSTDIRYNERAGGQSAGGPTASIEPRRTHRLGKLLS